MGVSNRIILSFQFSLSFIGSKAGYAHKCSSLSKFMNVLERALLLRIKNPVFQSLRLVLVSTLLLLRSTMALSSDYPTALDTFSGHFYKEAVKQPKNLNKNVVLSALSADVVMSMVALGARDETRKEITDSLAIESLESVTPSLRKTLEELVNVEGVELKLANKIYVKPYPGKLDSVAPVYRSQVQDVFNSDIQHIDFSKNVQAAKDINGWVERKTNNRIKDLISPDSIDSATAAVLVNAIYFKGSWAKKFDPEQTIKDDFHLADGSKVKVDMMSQKAKFLYAESSELDAKILVLPYEKGAVSMVIILPNKIDGLGALEAKLENGTRRHLQKLTEVEVVVKLPKFRIETTTDVKDVFLKLGASRVFDDRAQLDGILIEPEPLFVSKAIQKAFIEVNEEGAEAAAATGFVMLMRSAKLMNYEFIADRPFLYIVKSDNGILFSGHYVNPTN